MRRSGLRSPQVRSDTIIVGALQIRRPAAGGVAATAAASGVVFTGRTAYTITQTGGGGGAAGLERGTLLYDDVPSLPPRRLRRLVGLAPLPLPVVGAHQTSDRRAGRQAGTPPQSTYTGRRGRREERGKDGRGGGNVAIRQQKERRNETGERGREERPFIPNTECQSVSQLPDPPRPSFPAATDVVVVFTE